jgi:hypothetical protein
MKYVAAESPGLCNCMRALEQKLFPIGKMLQIAEGGDSTGVRRD